MGTLEEANLSPQQKFWPEEVTAVYEGVWEHACECMYR